MTAVDLWHFCETVYAEPEVEALCLRLQDEQGINVPLLLWCAWLESNGQSLSLDTLQAAKQRVETTSAATVEPLRSLRRRIKSERVLSGAVEDEVRQHMLKAELAIEKSLLRELEGIARNASDRDVDTRSPVNLLINVMALTNAESWLDQLRHATSRVIRK